MFDFDDIKYIVNNIKNYKVVWDNDYERRERTIRWIFHEANNS